MSRTRSSRPRTPVRTTIVATSAAPTQTQHHDEPAHLRTKINNCQSKSHPDHQSKIKERSHQCITIPWPALRAGWSPC